MKVDGFNTKQIGSIGKLNSLAGGLASTAITYGITGEATFNVLNIADFGANASSGLFEVSFNKDKGLSARLGTGGVDLSLKNLKSAISGLNAVNKNMQINKVAKQSNMNNVATALRVQYGFGDETQLSNLDSILKGQSALKAGKGEGEAQTITENGKRTIYLNNYKENMTREEKLAMGITIGHEAYRDGITSDAQSQYIETVNAVLGHTVMAKKMQNDDMYNNIMAGIINNNQNLQNDLAVFDYAATTGDWGAFGGYVGANYDSSADYWKLMDDGSLAYDGKANLYDENGNLIYKTDSQGIQGSLQEILGLENQTEAYNLMIQAGMKWDGKSWINSENSTDGSLAIKMDMTTGENGTGRTYKEIYETRELTDSTTGVAGLNARSGPSTSYGIVQGLDVGHSFIASRIAYDSSSSCPNHVWAYGYSEEEGWYGWVCSYYLY